MASTTFTEEEITEFDKLAVYILSSNDPDNQNVKKPLEGVEGFYYKVGLIVGVGESSIRNLYSDRKRGFTKSSFDSLCRQFFQSYDADENQRNKKKNSKIFIEWVNKICKKAKWEYPISDSDKEKMSEFFFQPEEENKSPTKDSSTKKKRKETNLSGNKISLKKRSKVTKSDFLAAIETISNYYNQFQSKYSNERKLFDSFKRILNSRIEKEDLHVDTLSLLFRYTKNFFSDSDWLIYELHNDSIIITPFSIKKEFSGDLHLRGIKHHAECLLKDNITKDKRCYFDLLGNYLTIKEETPNFFADLPSIIEIYNFSFEKTHPKICVGHKLIFHPKEGVLIVKAVAMRYLLKGNDFFYTKHEIYSNKIPEYIRSILFSHRELSVKPDPFLNIHITINEFFEQIYR